MPRNNPDAYKTLVVSSSGKKKKKGMTPHVPPKIKDPIPPATSPGGPHTPGAKKKRRQTELARRLEERRTGG